MPYLFYHDHTVQFEGEKDQGQTIPEYGTCHGQSHKEPQISQTIFYKHTKYFLTVALLY
jgi:hypothetical protein